MVAFKAAEVDAFISQPHSGLPIVLLYGPDAGLVRERADALIRSAVKDPQDPFAVALLDGDMLADEPERLVEEAHTIPLFGGRRAVLVKAGGRNISAALERLLASPPGADCRIVIEAGDLKRGSPLRTMCERAKLIAVLPCYSDSNRDLDRLIEQELRSAGLAMGRDARVLLISLLGGDRRASRSEIAKLVCYAHGQPTIRIDDVMAIVADATIPAVDGIVDGAFAGRTTDLEANFAKARASGISANAVATAALRHVVMLHRFRLAIDAGAAIDATLKSTTPAIHFSREPFIKAALERWSAKSLEQAIAQVGEIALEVRRNAKMSYLVMQEALLSIAITVRQKR